MITLLEKKNEACLIKPSLKQTDSERGSASDCNCYGVVEPKPTLQSGRCVRVVYISGYEFTVMYCTYCNINMEMHVKNRLTSFLKGFRECCYNYSIRATQKIYIFVYSCTHKVSTSDRLRKNRVRGE